MIAVDQIVMPVTAKETEMQLTEVLRGGRQCDEDGTEIIMSRQACHEAADEIERLGRRFAEAAEKALAFAESYEMAVARCVLALEFMHPEQKRTFNAAWADKRVDLRALNAPPTHASDCARHNSPAYPAGECDCGALEHNAESNGRTSDPTRTPG